MAGIVLVAKAVITIFLIKNSEDPVGILYDSNILHTKCLIQRKTLLIATKTINVLENIFLI